MVQIESQWCHWVIIRFDLVAPSFLPTINEDSQSTLPEQHTPNLTIVYSVILLNAKSVSKTFMIKYLEFRYVTSISYFPPVGRSTFLCHKWCKLKNGKLAIWIYANIANYKQKIFKTFIKPYKNLLLDTTSNWFNSDVQFNKFGEIFMIYLTNINMKSVFKNFISLTWIAVVEDCWSCWTIWLLVLNIRGNVNCQSIS